MGALRRRPRRAVHACLLLAYGVTACARPLTSGPSPRPLQARAPSASPARRTTFAPTPTFDGIRRELGPSDGAGDDGPSAPSPQSTTLPPTARGGLDDACFDTDAGALDTNGNGCDWNGYNLTDSPLYCTTGYQDDGDFTAMDMCCGCGGGGPAPTPLPTAATAVCTTASELQVAACVDVLHGHSLRSARGLRAR